MFRFAPAITRMILFLKPNLKAHHSTLKITHGKIEDFNPANLNLLRQRIAALETTLTKHKWKWRVTEPRQAAVLIPLVTIQSQPAMLFTVRSLKLSKNKGQVSFPGGIRDLSDADVIETALRETEEEVGVGRENVEILGQLAAVPSDNTLSIEVFPVIGYLGEINPEQLKFNVDEVSSVFVVSMENLIDPRNRELMHFRKDGFSIPSWPDTPSGVPIWGLTASILDNFLRLVWVADENIYQ
ncbi:nudix (nucleoside diphosphate linked moiety X)-type motif 8 [Nowakowskiella sp. JEL0078]|nr:nudix (nucleoside diphosphate linked moiety X)-type motif 8 [Nowakowskiella sp. JEL0078]